jgi:hypothetical protein
MPYSPLNFAIRYGCLVLATVFLMLANAIVATGADPTADMAALFGMHSALVFSMFCAIFSLLGLSSSLNSPTGRPLSLFTILVSASLLGATLVLLQAGGRTGVPTGFHTGIQAETANAPALAAAFLMFLRALGIVVLPPRGDRSGVAEASWSLALALAAGTGWWFVAGPAFVPGVLAATLLLSWPTLIDGINAFADKVFHTAALEAGARELTPGAFTKVARARDILIDKTALMSGPDLMVTNVMAFNNEPKTLLAVAASAEAGSDHPVAQALRQLASQWHVDLRSPDRFDPAPGLGVVALLGGQTVVIGTPDLLKQLKIDCFTADAIARSLEADGKTVLRVAVGGRVVGVLGLEGTLRQDAGVAGMALRQEGLVPWLACGDSAKTREALAGMLGLELPDNPNPGESAQDAAARFPTPDAPLVLSLSPDRMALELRDGAPRQGDDRARQPLAVSDTDDIGAFPALKALAMRRNLLAVHARRLLSGLWTLGGLCGAAALLPLSAAPVLLVICLVILWAFARFSVADTLKRTS